MKKLLLLIAIILSVYITQAQVVSNRSEKIPNATTAFGQNLAVGTKISDVGTGITYKVVSANGVADTYTITTALAAGLIEKDGKDEQELTWNGTTKELGIEDGNTVTLTEIETNEEDIFDLQAEQVSQGIRITQNENDITIQQGVTDGLRTDVNSNISNISDLQDTTTAHLSRIVQNEIDIAALESETHPAATKTGTPNFVDINESTQVITVSQVDLTTDVSGVLPDANVADDITLTDITQVTNRSHTDLQDIGTNTHTQIDSHISNTSNPHNVLATQITDFATEVSNNTTVVGNVSDISDLNDTIAAHLLRIEQNETDIAALESEDDGFNTSMAWNDGTNTVSVTDAGGTQSTEITGFVTDEEVGVANGVVPLDVNGQIETQYLPASILGATIYQGTWNASTNTPTLVSGTGTKGHYYVVGVEGNILLDGFTDWHINDWIVFNGTRWEKIEATNDVNTVNGQQGTVLLGLPEITQVDATTTDEITVGGLVSNGDITVFNTNSINMYSDTGGYIPLLTFDGYSNDSRISGAVNNDLIFKSRANSDKEGFLFTDPSDVTIATISKTGQATFAGNVTINGTPSASTHSARMQDIWDATAATVNPTTGKLPVKNASGGFDDSPVSVDGYFTGVGTDNPLSGFHIKSLVEGVNYGLRLESADGSHYWSQDANNSGNLRWYHNGTSVARFSDNNNFLINKSTDEGYKLDVNGKGRFQDDLTVEGNLLLGTSPTSYTFSRQGLGNVYGYQWGNYSYTGTESLADSYVISAGWQGVDGNTDNFDASVKGIGIALRPNVGVRFLASPSNLVSPETVTEMDISGNWVMSNNLTVEGSTTTNGLTSTDAISVTQKDDNAGISLFGFDDNSGSYFKKYITADGSTTLATSSYMKFTTGVNGYYFDLPEGGLFRVRYGSVDKFYINSLGIVTHAQGTLGTHSALLQDLWDATATIKLTTDSLRDDINNLTLEQRETATTADALAGIDNEKVITAKAYSESLAITLRTQDTVKANYIATDSLIVNGQNISDTEQKFEDFSESVTATTGDVHTLDLTPKPSSVMVYYNGFPLSASTYTVSTNTVQIQQQVYKYGKVRVLYTKQF